MKATNATPLERKIVERIRAHGPMPFVEYMRSCLYDPEFGYYGRVESRRFADFYTSVDVHPIFGRLLARQLAEMWDLLGRPAEFTVAESGAGTGRLAGHILDSKAGHFDASRFKDEYELALRKLVKRKAAGKRIEPPPEREETSNVIDLMQALRNSLKASGKEGGAAPVERQRQAASRRAAQTEKPKARRRGGRTA